MQRPFSLKRTWIKHSPQRNSTPKTLLSCAVHSLSSNRDIKNPLPLICSVTCLEIVPTQVCSSKHMQPLNFGFLPIRDVTMKHLYNGSVYVQKSKYLTPSSALVKLLGKISLGKETNGEVTRMAGGCRWQPGLHVTHPPLLVLAAGLGRPLTEMSSSGIY